MVGRRTSLKHAAARAAVRYWPRAVIATSALALVGLVVYPIITRGDGPPPLPQLPAVPPPQPVGTPVYVVQSGGDGIIGTLSKWVDFLKKGGPYAGMVAAMFWGWKKDREKQEADAAAAVRAKETYEQIVHLVEQQTGAMVKVDGTLGALKEVIGALDRRMERDR
jgi:hypothetical protein